MSDKPASTSSVASRRSPAGFERLRAFVQRISRPIEFASRADSARRSTVNTLGPFVTRQVIEVLADRVYRPSIESDLLALRDLFADFHGRLDPAEQQRRLETARMILGRLQYVETGIATRPDGAVAAHPTVRPPLDLTTVPIRFAHGVGPKRAPLLERLGIHSVDDALWFLPWRYEDRSVVTPIIGLTPGTEATICGTIVSSSMKRTFRRGMVLLDVQVSDDTGALHAVFFNQPYLERILKPGGRVMMSGRVSAGRKGWADLQFDTPQYELLDHEAETLHVGRIVPIYHETKGLTTRQLRVMMRGLLDEHLQDVPDVLPPAIRQAHHLMDIRSALADVHFPPAGTHLEALNRGLTRAHRRLAFEECFILEVALALRHRSVQEEAKGIRFETATPMIGQLQRLLPFTLTDAQRRVIADIRHDMGSSRPMNRLVQGDVGCGKTIVALYAMLIACGSGYQASVMVPTEILAEQHYLNLKPLVEPLGLSIVLLKSGGRTTARRATLDRIEQGQAHIIVGTHALIQKGVRFHKLGLAVIDEQHKFGVLQRKTLVEKGYRPDVLVMTATPIPRTLAMTVYGDLDASVIDALPPGRKPITTWLFDASQRSRAYRIIADEVKAGRQAYIVYPLVEESEKVDLQAAIQAAERLQATEFPQYRVGLLHGRMKSDEKEAVMAAFKSGEIQILVATTVIEVGVDVPKATVILIEHADRFGLAQLHQLRGRVGRGAEQSYCLLIASGEVRDRAQRSESAQRLEALVRSSDGFVIAEEDLRIRGPGEFFGVRQWGVPEFRAANLIRDRNLLEAARVEAFALVRQDPRLRLPAHRGLKEAMLRRWKDKLALADVS